jgi:hypothetical protein
MTQHYTPGPWKAKPSTLAAGPRFHIEALDREGFKSSVATVWHCNNADVTASNARLIEQAPALLSAVSLAWNILEEIEDMERATRGIFTARDHDRLLNLMRDILSNIDEM